MLSPEKLSFRSVVPGEIRFATAGRHGFDVSRGAGSLPSPSPCCSPHLGKTQLRERLIAELIAVARISDDPFVCSKRLSQTLLPEAESNSPPGLATPSCAATMSRHGVEAASRAPRPRGARGYPTGTPASAGCNSRGIHPWPMHSGPLLALLCTTRRPQ